MHSAVISSPAVTPPAPPALSETQFLSIFTHTDTHTHTRARTLTRARTRTHTHTHHETWLDAQIVVYESILQMLQYARVCYHLRFW